MSASNTSTSATSDDLTQMRRGSRARSYSTAVVVIVGVVLLAAGFGAGYYFESTRATTTTSGNGNGTSSTVQLTETGSSLVAPLFALWGPNYTKSYPNVQVTSAATGSGAGISNAEAGTIDMGATDGYLDAANASKYSLINVPVAISSQLVFYNVPGLSVNHLNLNGTVLAMIYAGVITMWNDPMIQAANPGVSLPSQAILPLHRSDGSGDTFLFTSLCYLSWKGWTYGYGTTVQWLSTSKGYKGNSGMVTGLQNTQYGIAYIGISYLSESTAAGLQYAAVGDQAANVNGTNPANYVLPTPQNISQDADLGLQNLQPPSVAISLILGGVPGATDLRLGAGGTMPTATDPHPYPLTNLEYILISTHPSNPSHQKQVVQFLLWALSYGNSKVYMDQVHFLALVPAVIGYDTQALQSVEVSS